MFPLLKGGYTNNVYKQKTWKELAFVDLLVKPAYDRTTDIMVKEDA